MITRRTLLKKAAAGASVLAIGFEIEPVQAAQGPPKRPAVNPLEAWVKIDPNGTVTLTCAKSEMGQGVFTSLPMVLADELSVDWNDVRVEQAITDPTRFGDQGTGGSSSVPSMFVPMRQAGAAAREMLIAAAAQRWGVDPKNCQAKNGAVWNGAQKLNYGELVEAASKLPIPQIDKVPLRRPGEFQIIGKSLPRKDIPAKVDGSAQYGIDVRLPGMLYAMVERCPTFGGKPKSFVATKAKAMPGVYDVFEIPAMPEVHSWGGVVVIADSTYHAMQARKQLQIDWDYGPHANESSESLRRDFRRIVDSKLKVVLNNGDTEAALSAAPSEKRIECDYELPFEAHATMEPMNCTMHIRSDGAEAWAPAQGPGWVLQVIAQVTKLPPSKIKVHTTFMGGGFGRRYQADFAMEAAQIAKQVGKPVQVIWSREDDMTHDFYRPASYHRLAGSVDSQGNITAWRHKSTSTPISEWWNPKEAPESSELGCTLQMPYLAQNYKLEYLPTPSGVPRAWWRSVEASSIGFVMESFMDELAHAAGVDPYEFRMQKLGDQRLVQNPLDAKQIPLDTARMKGVLKLAAEKGDWGKALPRGHGRGIACHFSFNSYAANVVEVAVEKRAVQVKRITSAVDIGIAINPNGVSAQVEGAIVYGLTAALKSQITIQNGGAVERNFNKFTTLQMKETPSIQVYIVPSEVEPTGIGEPGLPPVAPALMNAIFAAAGKRIRRLPIQPHDLV
ncbi:MAG TPA: xanthine dehydrogenase family protein molybdopterin-binding subunit [Bryobacteraceae bacterium]|jgi:isoquinoline 1-oxidoreductase beta subunit|nr:xanthine dehydrogenase family protein molybdopterin-binding subunit [Bryobacteraceae bacterium]